MHSNHTRETGQGVDPRLEAKTKTEYIYFDDINQLDDKKMRMKSKANKETQTTETDFQALRRVNNDFTCSITSIQPQTDNNFSLQRKNTFRTKTKDEIANINAKRGLSTCPNYISKKYNISIEEAVNKIKQSQDQRLKKFKKFLKTNGGYKREWSVRCMEYWVSRGFSHEEAIQTIKYRSDTRSIHAIANRRNITLEEAKKIQQEIGNKCRSTFNSKTSEENKDILLNKIGMLKYIVLFFEKRFRKLIFICFLFNNKNAYSVYHQIK